jgi:uncharacterized protein
VSLVYWDANLFIYLLEQHPEYSSLVKRTLARMAERGDRLCTSVFTRGEVLVGPVRSGDRATLTAVHEYLQPPAVELLPFTAETTDHYAQIRATSKVSPPDAIHLATAAAAGVDVFLTNDRSLHRMIVPGIQFVAGIDTNIF